MDNPNKTPNSLIHEKSPYLLQHAYNPVRWFPWGDVAFDKARDEDKPVFLSIGYSTCHWCHVMERESFENPVIAELLNQDFISVKVDREERPDVDSVYMSVCQAMNGQGGWPLTVIMTHDGKPFFSGTYFPPKARYGRLGLEEVLTEVAARWKRDRGMLLDSAGQIESYLKAQGEIPVSGEPGMGLVHQGYRQLAGIFDERNGGFGSAPKFPTPHNLMFLIAYGMREGKKRAVSMAEITLTQMFRGGIFDHIGGGFSRYSTDERWLVPHFEKMLYDNALLVIAYADAYVATGEKLFASVVQKILAYVETELRDSQGGFYCGQDADSDGVEGKYYVFTPKEIEEVLGKDAGERFCRAYDITGHGNFEGKSIPNLLGNEEYKGINDCGKLYEYRLKRTKLHRDDKILVSWNGWMICACARAGAVLGDRKYLRMAVRAEAFIRGYLVKENRLLVRYRDGDAAGEGKLDDYACYILALLELYQATFEADYLSRAVSWAQIMVQQFFDWQQGGFYLYAEDGEQLIVRTKETYDGAMPSGNSVAAAVLQKLAQITGETKWQEVLERQMRFLAGAMDGYPSGHSYALLAMMDVLYPTKELVCALASDCSLEEKEKLRDQIGYLTKTVPGLAVVVKTEENSTELVRLAPYTRDYPIPDTGMQFYLCSGSNCMPPVSELELVLKRLEERL